MIKHIIFSLIVSLFTATMTYPVTAQELSSRDKKIIQEYNQSIEKARRDSNEYNLPLCEFARWYSKSPKQPECNSFWTGWCWANRQPSIRVYDKPNGTFINALRGRRLLSPSERTGEKVSVYFMGEWGEEERWVKVFGPYKNQYRYWG